MVTFSFLRHNEMVAGSMIARPFRNGQRGAVYAPDVVSPSVLIKRAMWYTIL